MSLTIQTFYNNMASQYDKLFLDWQASTREQAELLNTIFQNYGYNQNAQILDCACEYRAVRRKELTDLLLKYGCSKVVWEMPEETGFYQPIVIARR